LQSEPDAHIVNVSSIFGLIGPPGQTAYAASKFAIRGFSESLREELRMTTKIRVTTVHPAGIATPIAEQARSSKSTTPAVRKAAEEYFKKVAVITPEETASIIIQGILGNKNRVLIGSDAYRMDRMQRLFPNRAASIFADWLNKRAKHTKL
jgi:short-subunit dehydrogenase